MYKLLLLASLSKFQVVGSISVLVVLSLLSLWLTSSTLLTSLFYPSFVQAASDNTATTANTCITYDSTEKIITIDCENKNNKSSEAAAVTLTDIYNQLKDPNILHRENNDNNSNQGTPAVWLLNAGIVIEKGSRLYINSTDASWLKIIASPSSATTDVKDAKAAKKTKEEEGNFANQIEVSGSLKIDSVKVTSWNPSTNNYATSEGTRELVGSHYKVQKGSPRPYISVESDATGTTDITNSEIAYLGYEGGVGGGPVVGLTYFGGDGSIIRGNNIHNLYFAFYSNGVGNITIENNQIHHSGHYGLDPHTGTHDMIIRNNTVHDNGSIGIICSLECYHIIIENNVVYNNTKRSIMLSRNMSDSIVRNNTISNEENGIVISESHDNEIYNNRISEIKNHAIDLDKESLENRIHHNVITVAKSHEKPSSFNTDNGNNDKYVLYVEDGAAKNNKLYSNNIYR